MRATPQNRNSRRSARPPGPRGDRWSGCLEEYEKDRLSFLLAARDNYGGVVTLDRRTSIVNDWATAVDVLDNARDFAITGDYLNRRLCAAEAADRDAARRHLNPGMRPNAVAHLAQRVSELTSLALSDPSNQRAQAQQVVEPLVVFERAYSQAITEFYFGEQHSEAIRAGTAGLLDALSAVFGNPFALPPAIPTLANLRIRRAHSRLSQVIEPLVRARTGTRPVGDFAGSVAWSAVRAGHSADRVCRLLIGSLLASQRVPAAAASWTLYELSRSPELATAVRQDETILVATIMEAGRLHPPTWLLERVATRPVRIGGYPMEVGHTVLVSPYVIHRDERMFAEPDLFRPGRWLDGSADPTHLLTFGRGIHRCPGRDASAVILKASIARLLHEYELDDASANVRAQAKTTLIPEGLRIRLTPRHVPAAWFKPRKREP